MIPEYWDVAQAYLCAHDEVLAPLIRRYDGEALDIKAQPFVTLIRSIVGQQISVKAADSIWSRVCTTLTHITPQAVLACPTEGLRGCGLSARKVEYMQAIAEFFMEHQYDVRRWAALDDTTIITKLTAIRGVGRWTAEMFLIFALGRPDVLPLQDIGLLKSMYRHYNEDAALDMGTVQAIADVWRPYRSVATWYLCRALDPVPVAY